MRQSGELLHCPIRPHQNRDDSASIWKSGTKFVPNGLGGARRAVSTLPSGIDELKPHIKLIAEIKRDGAAAQSAKQTQVYPALDFIQDISALDTFRRRAFFYCRLPLRHPMPPRLLVAFPGSVRQGFGMLHSLVMVGSPPVNEAVMR
jgi:hypothetical protein